MIGEGGVLSCCVPLSLDHRPRIPFETEYRSFPNGDTFNRWALTTRGGGALAALVTTSHLVLSLPLQLAVTVIDRSTTTHGASYARTRSAYLSGAGSQQEAKLVK